MKKISFAPVAFDDFSNWATEQPKIFNKIKEIIRDIRRNPFTGIAKPEPLRQEYQGCWSRRITDKHRLIYRVETDTLVILGCKDHY